ncbi:MmpS family transport accessory protein [Mycolicibacterium sp. CH28]|uniref:MmpS family transport accessory protein n=1 Tax=Mycolicibacterium sp. CH28 TaxID=2512237 RepID=UPI0013873528|nr:MmpS family transport accessory protein [Mycolicibacterium sp. CH28]
MNRTVGRRSYRTALSAAFIPVCALVLAPNAVADGTVIVYSVTSNGPLASVSYLDANNNRQVLTNVTAPWSITVTSPQVRPPVAVTARSTGTEVSCAITVNGQIVDRDSDSDGTPDVDCHEDYDD